MNTALLLLRSSPFVATLAAFSAFAADPFVWDLGNWKLEAGAKEGVVFEKVAGEDGAVTGWRIVEPHPSGLPPCWTKQPGVPYLT